MKKFESRREFLKTGAQAVVGASVLAGPLTVLARESVAERPSFRQPSVDSPRASGGLIHGIGLERPFSGTWCVRRVYGPVAGGLTLVLQEGKEGRPLRVDLCLLGDEPRAPVSTAYLELYVMDGGGGDGCIDEGLMEALQTLGRVIRNNEKDPRLLEGILTFEERWELYPDFMAYAAMELEPGVEAQSL